MSCIERDDAHFYCRYIAFPIMLVVYAGALGYTVRKLWLALASYDTMLACLFIFNCVFFVTRCIYWFDFLAYYPDEMFNFLNYWPHVLQTTVAGVLGLSWQIICRNFTTSFTASNSCLIHTAIGVGVAMNFAFIIGYFTVYSVSGCHQADVFSRLYIIISMGVAGMYVVYYGVKLISIIKLNLAESSTRKLRVIFSLAVLSFLFRVIINVMLMTMGPYIIALMEVEDGAAFIPVILFDYTFTEVLFMCGVTYSLTSQRERPLSSVEESFVAVPFTCDNSTASSAS